MTRGDSTRPGVKSDETLFALVDHLEAGQGVGVTELAERTGRAKSTVHDHLTTMAEHGFAVKRDGEYYLGLEFFRHGHRVRTGRDVYRAARPVVDDLVADVDEMVWLTTHENGRVMYLYGDSGETDVTDDNILGSWAYMHCNSGGKAMLAHVPRAEIERIVERHGLPARTEHTITERETLLEELQEIRDRGYAVNRGEDLAGIHAVGVPLVYEGTVRGALAVAGPAHRVTDERIEAYADRLLAASDDVELHLAY